MQSSYGFYQNYGKRCFDLLFGSIVLILVLPILLFAGIMVLVFTGRPIFFTQVRIGKDGKEFKIYKFRSMTVSTNRVSTQTRSGDSEVTGIGAILRRTKIDELPQLFNLLRGELSLVGPRPCLPQSVKDFDANGRKRLCVTPGITGLAQVNGNIELSWPERWMYDAEYVDNLSFWFDVKILAKTVLVVVLGESRFQNSPTHSLPCDTGEKNT
jgi:lipopolysaccharide/colanic/teichoic acid biosynthesis glycosyltransferase